MIKTSVLVLIATAATGSAGEASYDAFNMKYDSDFTLQMRTCFVGKMGNSFLEKNVNAMIDQYIDRFNDKYETHSEAVRRKNKDVRKVATVHNTEHNGYHYKIERESPELKFERLKGRNIWSVKYTAKSVEGLVTSSSTI